MTLSKFISFISFIDNTITEHFLIVTTINYSVINYKHNWSRKFLAENVFLLSSTISRKIISDGLNITCIIYSDQ